MLTDERIQKRVENIIVLAAETTVFESGDVSIFASKMFWIKNPGGSALTAIKVQACPNPASLTPDWADVDATTFAALAASAIKYLLIAINLRALRVRASTTAGAILTIASTPTAGGTGYTLDDILSVTGSPGGATVQVTGVSLGVVTAVALVSGGTGGYAVGTGKATTGGAGTGCTIEITAISGLISVWLDVQE